MSYLDTHFEIREMKKAVLKERFENGLWTSDNGSVTPLSELSTKHLENIENKLLENIFNKDNIYNGVPVGKWLVKVQDELSERWNDEQADE